MRKLLSILSVVVLAGILTGCGAGGNDPGRAYMPDMQYPQAYETYGYGMVNGEWDTLFQRGINYAGMPVPGTIARGDMLPYRLTGDSAGLAQAETGLTNPLDSASVNMMEAKRLYLVNCGICHGPALDGNGPIYTGGAYPAAPPSLMDAKAKAWTDGHYYHVITFGIRQMGSYASQLKPDQRWQVISYIRSRQAGSGSDTTSTATAPTTAAADTTN